jgi:hypothetical protein
MTKRHCGDEANTWHSHKSARRLIASCLLSNEGIKPSLLLFHLLVNDEQALDYRSQQMLLVEQLAYVKPKLASDCPWKHHAELFENATNLVLEVTTNADQPRPNNK